MPAAPVYDERLSVPLRWWALTTMFLASLLLAFLVSTPLWVALTGAGLLTVLAVTVLHGYGSARVGVADGVLYAGRARIAVRHLGAAVVLDREETRLLAGRDADARAYLQIRPYLRRGLRVDIDDPDDPAPYWLLGCRRPARLAEALDAARTEVRDG